MNNTKPSKFKTFILMPFGSNKEYEGGHAESNYVYEVIIKPAVQLAMGDENAKIDITREVDRNRSGSITKAIIEDILGSDVVIVDVTGRNPNVFLELGIRYTLRNKITIVIAQAETIIPFDIRGYRTITYNRFKPNEAREKIAKFIREGFNEQVRSDSIVYEVFPNMSVIVPGILESHGPDILMKGEMGWNEYVERVRWICELIGTPVKEGRFAPDALIGISNGGLIVADMVGRELFHGKPVLSLWANRFVNNTFFDNPFNQALMGALKESVETNHEDVPATILLLDDHFGTGNTSSQAIDYLQNQLGDRTSILFIPVVSQQLKYLPKVENFLPYQYILPNGENLFTITKEEFISQLNTKASRLPYFDKEIITGA